METKPPIAIPYAPRKHFLPIHADPNRWIGIVAHRRAGKSVFEINHLQAALIGNNRKGPPKRYAYIGPSFAQAKDLVWGYLKQYSAPIPGMSYSESELTARYPDGGLISLYGGATAYERMRGLYFDGVAMDEYPLLHPDAFTSVVRPALSDYRGFALVSGTSKGKDHFFALLQKWKQRTDCSVYDIKVTDTDALAPDEVEEARNDMGRDTFDREYMNSFDAAIEGAYYGDEMALALSEGRITRVPYDPAVPVMTCWDLGLDDEMSVWYFQRVRREIHWLEHFSASNVSLQNFAKMVMAKPRYLYAKDGHIFPHDVNVRELTSGKRRIDYLRDIGLEVTVAPRLPVEDGINACRNTIGVSWFDAEGCDTGLSALRSYQSVRSLVRDTNQPKPYHNWASHPADAFRTGVTGMELVLGWSGGGMLRGSMFGALRRNLRGVV